MIKRREVADFMDRYILREAGRERRYFVIETQIPFL
jgi:hypothetical protein